MIDFLSSLEHTAKKAAEQGLRFEAESAASPEGSAARRVENIIIPWVRCHFRQSSFV